jgi:hypothetical protein
MGYGLAGRNPLQFIDEQGWSVRAVDARAEIPIHIDTDGGVRLDELLALAMVARVLQPSKIFEIGTFMGRTTSALILNAAPGTSIVTLDLPLGAELEAVASPVDTDAILVKRRDVGALLRQLGIDRGCEQILCDSLRLAVIRTDASPHIRRARLHRRCALPSTRRQRHAKNGDHDERARPCVLARRWRRRPLSRPNDVSQRACSANRDLPRAEYDARLGRGIGASQLVR